ncbi:hypothetical protein AAFN85_18115 [Mucilaginibacter sp. CAU 1740]|uniref:hypothetical protein n=1 Tax=Mucilaginibacter sp. CAU 1740 TaxID=3140365 RepID=UPI00325A7722
MEIIDPKEAREMVERYKKHRKAIIDKHHGIRDTESTWVSVDHLKKFVENLPSNATGVRFHFGVHHDKHEISPNQMSIAFAPTVAGPDGKDIDALSSEEAVAKTGAILPVYNRGKDCPPSCP